MIREMIYLPRQAGKTTYLVERVQQAQDEGAEMVAVVTHTAREAQRWADHVMDWEIDPSRFVVFSAGSVTQTGALRGWKFDLVLVDNLDLMTDDQVAELDLYPHGIGVATATE